MKSVDQKTHEPASHASGVAIERACDQDSLSLPGGDGRAARALERERRRIELLASTAERLLATSDPLGAVNELAREVMEFLDCQVFFNFLVDEQSGRLRLNACAGIPDGTAREIEWIDFGVAVCGCVARDACRIIAEHIPTTPDPRTDLVKGWGVKAYACHPIRHGEKVLGTLSFGTAEREAFTEDEISLMKAVTDQVAIAAIRKRGEEERERLLGEVERQARLLDTIIAATDSRLAYLDRDLRYVRVNAAYAANARMAPEEFVGRHRLEVFPNAPDVVALYQRVIDTAEPATLPEYTGRPRYRPDAGPRTIRIDAVPVKDAQGIVEGLVTSHVDITELVEARRRAVEAERERAELAERLYAEINYRMKNNLLLVSSMLEIQLNGLAEGNPAAPELRQALTRIVALSVVHETLYRSQLGKVDLLEMLRRIAEVNASVLGRGRVDTSVTGETIYAASKLGSTLAMLANELIANAIEHGLPVAGNHLQLAASLCRQSGQVRLSVRNSGQSLPLGFDPTRYAGAGLQTVLGVVRNQLHGSFTIGSDQRGTTAEICFDERHLEPDEPQFG